jgi:regulator of protease activity HflC (stomatin/prohibitin superfamily)
VEFDTDALSRGSARATGFLTRLGWFYGGSALAVSLLLSTNLAPLSIFAAFRTPAHEAVAGGLAGVVLSTLLMTATMAASTWLLAAARIWHGRGVAGHAGRFMLRLTPGLAAREGQVAIVGIGAVLICTALWLLWPANITIHARAEPNLLGAVAIAISFVSLIAERTMAAFPAPQLPEAPALRRVLIVATLIFAISGALEMLRGFGWHWIYWAFVVLAVVPGVVAIEVALRALSRLFLPMPQPVDARAVVDSIVLDIVTRGPRAPSLTIRDHLGLDFTRSWALSYLTSLLLPAFFATALLCWGLSGLKLIDLSQRAVYERFGAPVAVLGPGIHLLLPWPLGIARPVEFGDIHEVKVGSTVRDAQTSIIPAEAIPPPSANHLWDVADPAEAEYLVASSSTDGTQGFQMVDAEIHVLYRTGLTDADAMAAIYGAIDQNTLVNYAASRAVAIYFASHTREQVMGAQRDTLAERLRALLAREVATYHAGVEIVGVHIESVHPPVGAAAAYHAVQAAEINANSSIFNELARARRMAGVSQEEAHQLETSAEASATERIQQAQGNAYQFAADRKADAQGPESFVMERKFSVLKEVLAQKPLTILDHRLTEAHEPLIDFRDGRVLSVGAGSAAPPAGNSSASAPSSSSETVQ